MATRPFNFNPGPSALPLPALEQAQRELLDIAGTGLSILEHSHRGPVYEKIHAEAIELLTQLLAIPDTHQVLFMQGGASAQFALVPMNLRTDEHAGDYVITDVWGTKAYNEAKILGRPHIAWNEQHEGMFTRVPKTAELSLSEGAPYLHFTSNNTVMGTQFAEFPSARTGELVADMSSDILSRPLDISRFGVIYAGAQKNMGPSGVTVVVIRKALLERGRNDVPSIFRYREIAKNNSLQNTITTFSVYLMRNVLAWVKSEGGVLEMERRNRRKAALVYEAIERSNGYYTCPVDRSSRSLMNVVFQTPSADLDARFVLNATAAGLFGLKGHKLRGGLRASLYNAVPLAAAEKLVDFMDRFAGHSPKQD